MSFRQKQVFFKDSSYEISQTEIMILIDSRQCDLEERTRN